jgi:anti-anti-sigma factor
MPALEIIESEAGTVRVVELAGRLDNLTVTELDAKAAEWAGKPLVLDLERLDYISSAGLRSILGLLKRMHGLALAAPQAAVLEVLEISGFRALAPVFPDRAGAVASLT